MLGEKEKVPLIPGAPKQRQKRGREEAGLTPLPLPTHLCPAVPPTISVPKGRAVVTVREGSPAELQCEVRGKPRPPVLWSRVDKEAALLPSGLTLEETPDGKLRLERVSRDLSGTYRCQTARYNGFNVRHREAQVQLNVQCESAHAPLPGWAWPSSPPPLSRSNQPYNLPGRPVLQDAGVCVPCTTRVPSHLHFQGPGKQRNS